MHYIYIQQEFSQSVAQVFSKLADHECLGQIMGADIQRTVDAPGENPNGLGSVRRIRAFPAPDFEETITKYIENEEIQYRVTRGSPVKEHLGTLLFFPTEQGCRLEYSIQFEPRLAIPLWGRMLRFAIRFPIQKGLRALASKPLSKA